ncbi:MAG: DUF4831 family protein [Bacteroidales bacterium]|nr:DUF4831 family protein [Bacteroidales bacterium]
MMKKVIWLMGLLVGCLSLSHAQQRVVQLPVGIDEVPSDNSFCYMLPKTAFKVDVTVTRVTEMKGYFSDYAEKLLGLKHVTTADKTRYELKNVALTSVSLPDSNYIYAVEPTAAQLKTGMMDKIRQKTSQPQVYAASYEANHLEIPEFFKNYSEAAYIAKEDSYVETKIVNGVVVQVPVNQTKIVSKSLDKQAQEAADFIMKIRSDRYDLTAGTQEVAYPKETMEYMVQELNRLEKNYMDLFTGLTVKDELHYTVFVVPEEGASEQFAFAVDPQQGFTDDANSTGNKYYLKYAFQYDNRQAEAYNLTKWKVKNYKFNDGYRIRQALPAYVSLNVGGHQLTMFGLYPVYQLGSIVILPRQDNVDITSYGVFVY